MMDLSPDSDREVVFAALSAQGDADAAAALERQRSGALEALTEVSETVHEVEAAQVQPMPEPALEVEYDNLSAPVTIRLASPFSAGGERVKIIGLRPPTFGDVEAVTSGAISELEMHARMAGVSPAVLRALRWDDAEKVFGAARQLAPEFGRR